MSIDVPLTFPLDRDGFLRRACSQCEREFKWHHGPAEGAPATDEPTEEYFCPYCGEVAALDQWYTTEQVEYIHGVASAYAMSELRDQLGSAMESLNRGGLVSVELEGAEDVAPPASLVEPTDMLMVASPCHPYEPVKVFEEWTERLHCLVCGAPYRLP